MLDDDYDYAEQLMKLTRTTGITGKALVTHERTSHQLVNSTTNLMMEDLRKLMFKFIKAQQEENRLWRYRMDRLDKLLSGVVSTGGGASSASKDPPSSFCPRSLQTRSVTVGAHFP